MCLNALNINHHNHSIRLLLLLVDVPQDANKDEVLEFGEEVLACFSPLRKVIAAITYALLPYTLSV